MARKKKPALHPEGFGPELEADPFEESPEPLTLPEPEEAPKPVTKPRKRLGGLAKSSRPGVKLEVFLRASGKRPDQMAGFRRWAINQGLKPMGIKDWRKEYARFLSLPV